MQAIVKGDLAYLQKFIAEKNDCDLVSFKHNASVRLFAPRNLSADLWKELTSVPVNETGHERWKLAILAILNRDHRKLSEYMDGKRLESKFEPWSLAHYAVRVGDKKLLELLIKHDYPLDSPEETKHFYFGAVNPGMTPLLLACRIGNLDIIDFLLDHGANPKERDVSGKGVLLHSILSGNLEVADFWATKGIGRTETNHREDIWAFAQNLGGDILYSWVAEHFGDNKKSETVKREWEGNTIVPFTDLTLPDHLIKAFNSDLGVFLSTPKKSRGIILFGERGCGKTEIANHLLQLNIPNLHVIKIGAIERNDLARRMSELTHHSVIVFDDSDLVFESSPRSLVQDHERKGWIALIERFMREVGHYWVFLGSFESTLASKDKFSREDLLSLFGSSGDLINGTDGQIPSWKAERLMKALRNESRNYTDEALINLLHAVTEKKMGIRGLLNIHQKLKAECGQNQIDSENVKIYVERYLC